jgi:gas vesicle protein
MFNKNFVLNKNVMVGSLAGGAVGAIIALLFAPKSGKDLIRDLYLPLSGQRKKTHKTSVSKMPPPSSIKSKAHRTIRQATPKKAVKQRKAAPSHTSSSQFSKK